ncbi:Retrovirus-related Pol polyprotein from transposon 17.6, partial [Mucuna pruriens]
MEVFMDDFTVYVESFDACLENLSKVLTRCIDTNLVLNFEKGHFMVTEGIVLGHLVSNRDIEVDKSKIDIITSLPNIAFVREVRSFLGHVGFYKRFIKNFSKIVLPLTKLLQKDPCIKAFHELKNQLTFAPILQAPNWELPFKLIIGSRLRLESWSQQPVHVIAYASRTMDPTQLNYTTTEKELLAIVFALTNFILTYWAPKSLFLLKKPDAKLRLIRWMLLLQEFNIEIRDKKDAENSIADHLSQIKKENDSMPIRDEFPDEQLLHINMPTPWFANIYNFVAASQFPPKVSRLYKETSKRCQILTFGDSALIKCILDAEIKSVLQFCHAASGGDHYGSTRMTKKVLDCGDAYQFISTCKKCQKDGMAISRRHEMPQQPVLFYEVFDVWDIDFIGPFLVSNGYLYILLVVDYVSQWVEAIATKTNDGKVVVDFLKSNIFCRFGVSKALISDQGSHFCNKAISSLLHKYEVVHRIATTYHPIQTAKLKYSIGKSKKHCKRWPIPTGRTGADSLRTFYGHTELHTKLRWGSLPIGLSIISQLR